MSGFSAGQPEHPAPGVLSWPARGPAYEPARGTIGLLHGVTSSAGSWWAVAPALAADGWDVTAVDLPGHGEGPRPRADHDVMTTLVNGTVARLPPRLVVLVGHSLGAIVALAAAARHPGIAAGLVLEDPPGRWSSGIDKGALADAIEAQARAVRDDRQAFWQRERDTHPSWDDADVDQVISALELADAAGIGRALREGLAWDISDLVASVQIPVLVIAAPETAASVPGDGGSALLGPDREAVRRLVPEERFVVLDGSHSLHREQPKRVAELIAAFAGLLVG